MLLLLYLFGLALISFITKKKSKNLRHGLRLGFSFVFVLMMQLFSRLAGGASDIPNVIGESLFMSVQNITFNSDIAWADGMSAGFRTQMWLIVFIASVLTAESVLAAFFGRFFSQLRLKSIGAFRQEHFIIYGTSADAQLLIADIRKNIKNPHIIYIPAEPLDDDTVMYGECRVENPSFLFRLNPRKTYRIVLLPNPQLTNLDLLYQLNENGAENIHVTAFLHNDIIRFQDIHTENIDACVLSAEQLLIYKLFDGCSPIDVLKSNRCFNENALLPYLEKPMEICLIGFDDLSREFLLYTFENAAFLTKDDTDSFHATVIDDRLSVTREAFLTEVPYFENNDQISFVDAAVGTEDYYDAVKRTCDGLGQIFISTGDTLQNIRTAVDLCRFYDRMDCFGQRPQMIVVLSEPFSGAETLLGQYPDIMTVDVSKKIMNYDTLIALNLDTAAKEINEQYRKNSDSGKEWNKLGTFTQASNRAVIRDEYNKKALYEMCRADKEKTLDFLARYEHSRWNAFYHAHGWKRMPVGDLTEEERDTFVTKHPDEKRHICLVGWDELDDLPQRTPGLLKYYDVENVRQTVDRL